MTRMPLSFTPMSDMEALVAGWWDDVNGSSQWQDGIFYTLCAAYALVSSIALVPTLSLSLLFLLCDSILCSGSLCILGMIMMNWETVIMIMNVCLACCIFIVMNHCDLGVCVCVIVTF